MTWKDLGALAVPLGVNLVTLAFSVAAGLAVACLGPPEWGRDWYPWLVAAGLPVTTALATWLAYDAGKSSGVEEGRAQGFSAGRQAAAEEVNAALYKEQVRLRTQGITGVRVAEVEDHPALAALKEPRPLVWPDRRVPPGVPRPPKVRPGDAGEEGG